AILRSGTPLVHVTMAGVIAQRAGVWHLGLEGVMIIGACATILGIVLTGSFPAAIAIASVLCVAASVLLWFVIEKLGANPIIAGLGLTGLGIGGTALAVQALFGSLAAVTAPFGVPRLGATFGSYGALSIFVLMMPFVVWGMWALLCRTRFGLRLAAAGEHPLAARSVGTRPATARLIALAAGGILCAIGGAELAAGGLTIFAQNMTAGRGFMSFAAVIFGAGHPVGAAFAALFFSLVGVAGIRLQLLFGASIPHDVLLSLPYMATILGVWISGRMRGGAKAATQATELRDY
ncbi:MAG: ABC transporter permease, partial [Rhodospirillales bacterium]|nr:ABC transporter permease [Rhodospirillales bacterium]